jgi:AraC-like DNA-binding protein
LTIRLRKLIDLASPAARDALAYCPGLASFSAVRLPVQRGVGFIPRFEESVMIESVLTLQQWEQVAREADFNPAKMASIFSISQRQLQRLFRKNLECTPSRWLRELQCRLAKELIAHGYSNKAAAAELKFASESHFCREFKKRFGTSPQSFAPTFGANGREQPIIRLSKKSWNVLRNGSSRHN